MKSCWRWCEIGNSLTGFAAAQPAGFLPHQRTKLLSANFDGTRRWYYDSCTLDRKEAYAEIINAARKYGIVCLTSYLGIGEAHGTCLVKGEEQTEALLELLSKLGQMMRIVDNDDIDKELSEVRKEFPSLTFTDAIHLATAIKYKCENLRTNDQDLIGLPKKKVLEVAQKHGCPKFAISYLKA